MTEQREGSHGLDDASFRALAEVSPAGIWRTTADGQCTYVNPAWLQSTGLRDDQWQGEGWADALHPDDAERVFESFGAAVAAGEDFHDEWRWLRPDGSTPWVLCMGAPEIGRDGKICAYVGINIDISERHRLTEDLEKARERAEHAAMAKARFLANMSHEIRTPMNGVIGFTDLLLASDLDENQRRYAVLIADSGRAMMSLLNDVLDVSKIEAGQLAIEKGRIDLHRKLRHCLSLMEPTACAKSLALELDIEPNVPQFVFGDPLRLRQILLNLLGNAMKFTDVGTVRITACTSPSSHGERLRISVSDTGRGIAADKLASIFDPFSQADSSTARVHGGTGLGLSISRQLAQRLGGALDVSSELGTGSVFTLDLPLERAPQRQENRAERAVSDASALVGKRVLVAEDHDINQQLIMALCHSLGLEVAIAKDGEEALAMALEARGGDRRFDAVLMDVQMPRLDGLGATRRLRNAGVGAGELPIVALSANCYPDDIAACIDAGMQAHVGKPVETERLVDALLPLIGRPSASGETLPEPSAAPASSKMKALAARFEAQRDDVLDQIESCVRDAELQGWEAIARQLHKIAGTAAYFDRADLGGLSRELEIRLKSADAESERLEALRSALPQLRRAA